MQIVAHRGGAELFPENTMTAILGLEQMGVDMIECDVHLSADGELVAIHDDNLLRTAGVNRKVLELTRTELKKIAAGDEFGIPSLTDLLEASSLPFIVELKTPQTVLALEKLLAAKPQWVERVHPFSFYHDILLYLRNQFPAIACGALLAGFVVDPVQVARAAKCQMLSLHHEGLLASYVERCHEGGILVSVWNPITEQEIANAINAKVDGIGSDRPDLVIKLVSEDDREKK